MDETLKAMLEEAAVVALRFSRKNAWASKDDLAQEARLAVLDAYKRYDGKRNPLAYAGMVATYACRAWVGNYVSPVSVSWRHRGEVTAKTSAGAMPLDGMVDEAAGADEVLVREQGLKLSSERIAQLLAEGKEAELAALVLMGQKSAEVAEKAGVPVQLVYRARNTLARKLKNDPVLMEAWESLR